MIVTYSVFLFVMDSDHLFIHPCFRVKFRFQLFFLFSVSILLSFDIFIFFSCVPLTSLHESKMDQQWVSPPSFPLGCKSITQAFMLKLKKQWLDKISRPWVLFCDHLSVQTQLSFLCLALISLAFLFSIIDTSLGDLHRFHPTILKRCFRSVTNIEMSSYHSMLKYFAFRRDEKEHFVQTILCV